MTIVSFLVSLVIVIFYALGVSLVLFLAPYFANKIWPADADKLMSPPTLVVTVVWFVFIICSQILAKTFPPTWSILNILFFLFVAFTCLAAVCTLEAVSLIKKGNWPSSLGLLAFALSFLVVDSAVILFGLMVLQVIK